MQKGKREISKIRVSLASTIHHQMMKTIRRARVLLLCNICSHHKQVSSCYHLNVYHPWEPQEKILSSMLRYKKQLFATLYVTAVTRLKISHSFQNSLKMCSFAQLKAASNSCWDRAKLFGSNRTPPPAGRLSVFPWVHAGEAQSATYQNHVCFSQVVPSPPGQHRQLHVWDSAKGTQEESLELQDVRGAHYYQGDKSVVLALHKPACLFSHTELDFDKGKRMIQHLIRLNGRLQQLIHST